MTPNALSPYLLVDLADGRTVRLQTNIGDRMAWRRYCRRHELKEHEHVLESFEFLAYAAGDRAGLWSYPTFEDWAAAGDVLMVQPLARDSELVAEDIGGVEAIGTPTSRAQTTT